MGRSKVHILALSLGSTNAGGLSGGERFVLEVWSDWARRSECDLTVVASLPGYLASRRFGYDIPTFPIRVGANLGKVYAGYVLRAIAASLHAIRYQPDLLFAGSAYFFDIVPALTLKLVRKRAALVVPVFHFIPPPSRRRGSVAINILAWMEQQLMLRLVVKCADLVVTASEDVATGLCRLGLPRRRILVTALGIRSMRSARDYVHHEFDAISVGRFSHPKGTVELLQAWRVVSNKLPTARLALVGANAPGFDIDEEVARLGLTNNAVVYQSLGDAQVERLMRASKCFVSASREEGYGLAVAEALGMGLPCVTYDIEIFRTAFPRGRMCPTHNTPEELGLCVLRLLEVPEIRQKLVNETISGLDLPTWENIANALWERVAEIT